MIKNSKDKWYTRKTSSSKLNCEQKAKLSEMDYRSSEIYCISKPLNQGTECKIYS